MLPSLPPPPHSLQAPGSSVVGEVNTPEGVHLDICLPRGTHTDTHAQPRTWQDPVTHIQRPAMNRCQSSGLVRASGNNGPLVALLFPQDYCGGNPGTFRILVGNEGCSHPSVKCKKHVTILVEGGEIELFDGEVSAASSPPPSCPALCFCHLRGTFSKHSFRTCVNGIMNSH